MDYLIIYITLYDRMSLIKWREYFIDGRVRLVLGSASIPRKNILESLGIPFEVRVSDFVEDLDKTTSSMDYPLATSWGKHRELRKCEEQFILVTCDTVVVSNEGIVLEKPDDDSHAFEILTSLSGKTHKVVTGVVVSFMNKYIDFSVVTDITFKTLNKLDIEAYIATGEPRGKAGAFGIHGLGQLLVKNINGSFSNVVGIPLAEVSDAIAKLLNDNLLINSE